MKCKKTKLLISGYLDGVLEKKKEKEFIDHIKGCEACRKELESTEGLLKLFSEIKPVVKDAAFYQSIMSGFYINRANVSTRHKFFEEIKSIKEWFTKPVVIGICGALLLAAILIYSNFMNKDEQFASTGNEIEFLLEEHALFEEQKIFSGGAYSTVLASSSFYQKPEVREDNERK